MHEHQRKVPYAAENRSRSRAMAAVTGTNRSLPTAVQGPPRARLERAFTVGAAVQVPAPRNVRGDPHVRVRTELAGPLDQLGGSVDPQEARRPRAGGRQGIDHQGDLRLTRPDGEELSRPLRGPA